MSKFLKFFTKKIGIFSKIFFLKVVHSTLKRRQKNYFGDGIVFFQNFSKFFNFFSLFMPQRTVLDYSESDPATSPHYERAYCTAVTPLFTAVKITSSNTAHNTVPHFYLCVVRFCTNFHSARNHQNKKTLAPPLHHFKDTPVP